MKPVYLIITVLIIACNPKSNLLFKEVSMEKGIDYIYPGNDGQEVGAGITVLDVNNDGWDDIFQSGGNFASKLWINNKGKFIDATLKFNLEFIDSLYIQGASAADFDNDGFVDLFITNMGIPCYRGDNSIPFLLKNIEGKYFKPVFQETFNEISNYSGCVWGDINGDGYVDLYVLNYLKNMENEYDSLAKRMVYIPDCLENKFYLNLKGKGFKEISRELKLDNDGCGLAACFTDYDNDNDVDLLLLNDFGQFNHKGNKLFRNEFPKLSFTDITDSIGFTSEFYGMGVGPGDYNNDGIFDYYLTNIGKNSLYQNSIIKFQDKSKELGVDESIINDSLTGTSWSGLFFDMENDGDLDLYIAKGYLNSLEKVVILDDNKLFENKDGGGFTDISKYSGLNDSLAHRGAAFIDFDHDGDLDIVSGVIKMGWSQFAKTEQKIKLFENKNKTNNNWIGIKLEGIKSTNKSCVGCSASFKIEDKTYIREVDGGSGHSSQSTKTLYFGLGNNKSIEHVTIQFIGGEKLEIQELKANKVYKINSIGDIEIVY